MVAIGDKTRRKVHAVTTPLNIGETNFTSAGGLLRPVTKATSIIVFDPLETLSASTYTTGIGNLMFTAPYSRFYKVNFIYKVYELSQGSPDRLEDITTYNEGVYTVLTNSCRIRKNGFIPAPDTPAWLDSGLYTIGGINTNGSVLAPFETVKTSQVLLSVGDSAPGTTTYMAAQADCVTFLEAGDTLEFAYVNVHNGIRAQLTDGLAGLIASGASSFPILGETFTLNVDNAVAGVRYRQAPLRMYSTLSTTPPITFDATGYVEITELDRD